MATLGPREAISELKLDAALKAQAVAEPDGPCDCTCCVDRREEERQQRQERNRRTRIIADADQLIPAACEAAALIDILRAAVGADRVLDELAQRYPPSFVCPERDRLALIRCRIRHRASELLRP